LAKESIIVILDGALAHLIVYEGCPVGAVITDAGEVRAPFHWSKRQTAVQANREVVHTKSSV
jgi:hypothetical protein